MKYTGTQCLIKILLDLIWMNYRIQVLIYYIKSLIRYSFIKTTINNLIHFVATSLCAAYSLAVLFILSY